jgi:antitoxin HicB
MMNREELYGYSVCLIRLSEEDGGGWLAEVPELLGCLADGESPDEALNNLKEVIETWIEVAREEEQVIPEPRIYLESDYSGKFTLRVPKTLHRLLSEEADKEGVSLNQLILSLVSYNFGIRSQERSEISNSGHTKRGTRFLYEVWTEGNDDPAFERTTSLFKLRN